MKIRATEKPSQTAIREARKRYGPRAMVRDYNRPSSPELRAEAARLRKEAKADKEAIEAEIQARLAACDWYQELVAKRRAAYLREQAAIGGTYYRFSVGKDVGIAFEVRGQGDTWDEAFANADAKTANRKVSA